MSRERTGWRTLGLSLAFLASTAGLTIGLKAVAPGVKIGPDYICYWSAGVILGSGQNPYDTKLQTEVQAEQGWDKEKDGLGIYPFLPFYYPPWFAMLCVCLVPLGFETARVAWIVIDGELLLIGAYLLRNSFPGLSRAVVMVAVPLFVYSWSSVVIGQTTPLIFFLLAASWRLAEGRRDRLAGMAMAWLSIKPQLTGILLLGLLAWSARTGRWRIIQGFVATMAVLAAVSFALLPGWLGEFLRASRVTRPPTDYFPWIGTTWFLFLKGVGLRGVVLILAYLGVALPFLAAMARTSLDRTRPIGDIFSIGLLAAYVVAPYGRHYDFPVLLIPAMVIMSGRITEWLGAVMLLSLLALPYLQYIELDTIKQQMEIEGSFNPEITFSWVPLLLTIAWFTSKRGTIRSIPD